MITCSINYGIRLIIHSKHLPLWISLIRAGIKVNPCAHPTNGISIEFEIRSKFAGLWFHIWSAGHNEFFRTSRQFCCRDECKISFWSVAYVRTKSITKFQRISNSIEISSVGRASCWNEALWTALWFTRFCCVIAATKQLYKWYFPSVRPSVRLPVCLSHFLTMFPSSHHHEIFRSYYQWPK